MAKKDPKHAILEAALPDVPFDGWTDALLDRAAKKAKADARAHFPRGVTDLVLYFSAWADAQLIQKTNVKKIADLRVRDRVTACVRLRLEILEPHKEALRLASAFMANPLRAAKMGKAVWKSADAIWSLCGDSATDYNRYTKRFLLTGVLSGTTLYWLQDDSKGHADSWDFLDRRIENVMTLGRAMASIKPKKESHAA